MSLIVPLIFPSKLCPAIWGVAINDLSINVLFGTGSLFQTSLTYIRSLFLNTADSSTIPPLEVFIKILLFNVPIKLESSIFFVGYFEFEVRGVCKVINSHALIPSILVKKSISRNGS